MRRFLYCEAGFVEKTTWQEDCWVNIELPTREDILYLTETLSIPDSFLSDIEDVDERPRIEIEDGWTMMILRIPYHSAGDAVPYITVPLGIILKEHYLITVCHYATDMISDFIRYIDKKNYVITEIWDLVFRLFLSSSVWYLKYLKQLNAQTRDAEWELELSVENEELHRLLKIEKSYVFFITSLQGNDSLLTKLKNLRFQREFFDEELVEDVEIELKQALETSRIYSDILSSTMDSFASVISNNLGVIMKRMTAISVILMVPTLIASFYGMNVPNGMETYNLGFILICIISIFLSGIAVWYFRKRNWF